MAVCPFAVKKLIPAGSNDPRITARVAILHVDAGNAESLYDFFKNRSGGIESHFHVRKDGVIEQYRDTAFQADANNLANDFAVSIETQGFGAGEWTPEQLESIKRLLVWLNKVHDIPLRKVQRWDGSGVGYHTLFGAPSQWTPVAKSCPGPDRIRQFNDVLVPWFKAPSATKEDDLNAEDRKTLNAIAKDVNALRKSQGALRKADRERFELVLRKVREATRLAQASATPADVRGLLNDIDATITLVVSEADEAARS